MPDARYRIPDYNKLRMQLSVIRHPASSIRHQGPLTTPHMAETNYDRRAFMAYFSSIGLGTTLFPGVLWAQAQQQQQGPAITKEMVAAAEQLSGLEFSDE
jgi:hypothetical protein